MSTQSQLANARPEAELSLSEIYEAHAGRVAWWVARLGGPSIDAEDLVHEVFLVVNKQLPTFRGESKLSTWLYRITANIVRDRRRQERRRFFRIFDFWNGKQQAPLVSVPTPVEELERQQATRLVYQVLDTLNENYRTVLILFELEGFSGEEIAELLQVKLNTIWIWLRRARSQFRECMTTHHAEELTALLQNGDGNG